MLLYLLFLFLSSPAFAGKGPEKHTVCTVTINSDHEKKTFRKYLNPKDFDFVELAPKKSPGADAEAYDWFAEACKKGVQCDVVLISGHFAGGFFSESGDVPALALDEMEKKSCDPRCKGIFSRAREVFLFGCNTLADKDSDRRTPDEYRRVLMNDGMSSEAADRIVQARYGLLGASNKARMQMIFQGVPRLYGFSSVGPLGARVQGFLENYFKEKGDYAQHLEKEAVASMVKSLDELNRKAIPTRNEVLARALKPVGNFAQCSALLPGDPQSEIKKVICQLRDENLSVAARLKLLGLVAERKDFLNYFESVEEFLRKHPPEKYSDEERALLGKVTENLHAKKLIFDVIDSLRASRLKADLIVFAKRVGWFGGAEGTQKARQMGKQILKGAVVDWDVKTVLEELLSASEPSWVTLDDLPLNWPSDDYLRAALSNADLQDPALQRVALDLAKKDLTLYGYDGLSLVRGTQLSREAVVELFQTAEANERSFTRLARLFAADRKAHAGEIVMRYTEDSRPEVRAYALNVLAGYVDQIPEARVKIQEALASPSAEVRASILSSFQYNYREEWLDIAKRFLRDPEPPVRREAINVLGAAASASERVSWSVVRGFAAEALEQPENLVPLIRTLELVRGRDSKLEDLLVEKVKDGSIFDRSSVIYYLGSRDYAEKSRQWLLSQLDQEPRLRAEAAMALLRRGYASENVERILRYASDPGVREELSIALQAGIITNRRLENDVRTALRGHSEQRPRPEPVADDQMRLLRE